MRTVREKVREMANHKSEEIIYQVIPPYFGDDPEEKKAHEAEAERILAAARARGEKVYSVTPIPPEDYLDE